VTRAAISFLPGPAQLHPDVLVALSRTPAPHRGAAFLEDVASIKAELRALTGARHVSVMLGSGTIANDVVAAQLRRSDERGLVLVNGEFGERLSDHARRAGATFDVERLPWGVPFDGNAIERALAAHPAATWVWMVHLETSTGVVNDLPRLTTLAHARGMRIAVDGVSAIGSISVQVGDVDFATAVSGKGIGSVPGVAIICHRERVTPDERIARSLDLGLYAGAEGVPFTLSSNLIWALSAALGHAAKPGRMERLATVGAQLRVELERRGHVIVAPVESAAPSVVTVALGADECVQAFGDALAARGILTSYRSDYLVRRNWIQAAVMGECTREQVDTLLAVWDEVRGREPVRDERARRGHHPLGGVAAHL